MTPWCSKPDLKWRRVSSDVMYVHTLLVGQAASAVTHRTAQESLYEGVALV